MKTSTLLCGLCLLPLLAVAHVAEAQTPSPYRPPAAPAISTQSSASVSPAGGQCTGAPAGATLVSQGKGSVPAPRGGQPTYAQVALNLANYAVGGLLTIQITAGNGGAATFELFPGNATFGSNGAPNTQPIVAQANVAAGSCVVLTLNFSQAGSFILAATSSSGANGSSTFQYAAYVQPSFAGVFSGAPSVGTSSAPTASAARPASTAPTAPPSSLAQPAPTQGTPSQGSSMFNGVFSPTPATQSGTGQPVSTAQSVAAASVQPAPAGVSQVQSAAQAQVPDSTSPSSSSSDPSQPSSSSSVNTPLMIEAVTIQNSPGVPDTGGHCIICGLVTGNLTAVEPNLVICVTPSGRTDAARSCTGVCNPGHDCHAPLERQVMLLSSSHAVHVEILDNDKQGKVQQLAAFDENDATQCTTDQPCMADESDAQSAGTTVSFEFGKPEGCDASASGSASIGRTEPLLVASTLFLAGLLPAQAPTQTASSGKGGTCGNFTFTSYSGAITSRQLYQAFRSLYDRSPGFKSLMRQVKFRVNIVVVDPKSPQYKQLSDAGVAGYKNFNKNNKTDTNKDPGYTLPNANEFAFTLRPDEHGAVDVVISATTLEYGYYSGKSPTSGNYVPQVEPIQLILAYELGSNVFGLATDPCKQEEPRQTTTNAIMEQAWPLKDSNGNYIKGGFVPNEATVLDANGNTYSISGSEYYINGLINGKSFQHGVYDQSTGQYFQPNPNVADPPSPPETIYGNGTAGDVLGPLDLTEPPCPVLIPSVIPSKPSSPPPPLPPPPNPSKPIS